MKHTSEWNVSGGNISNMLLYEYLIRYFTWNTWNIYIRLFLLNYTALNIESCVTPQIEDINLKLQDKEIRIHDIVR